jgi:hypothetical protein
MWRHLRSTVRLCSVEAGAGAQHDEEVQLYAFDCLAYGGDDLTRLPHGSRGFGLQAPRAPLPRRPVRSLAEGQEPEAPSVQPRRGPVLMNKIPSYTRRRQRGPRAAGDRALGNCPTCGALVDMRDLAQIFAHMLGQIPLVLTDRPALKCKAEALAE